MEPSDLSSLVGASPVRVAVEAPDGSPAVNRAVLEAIGLSLSLAELGNGTPVAIGVEIQESLGPDGGQGYPYDHFEYVVATAAAQLQPEHWYELRLPQVPPELRLNPVGLRSLADGGVSARLTTGSHPTLQSLQGCAKSDGSFRVEIKFSEAIILDADMAAKLTLVPLQPLDTCTMELPNQPGTSVDLIRFVCQLASTANRQFQLSVAQTITSTTGAKLERSPGTPGDYSLLIEESMWRLYDVGCSSVPLNKEE